MGHRRGQIDQRFRVGARDQRVLTDDQRQPVELALAGDPVNGLAFQPPFDGNRRNT